MEIVGIIVSILRLLLGLIGLGVIAVGTSAPAPALGGVAHATSAVESTGDTADGVTLDVRRS
jgi:hypothetical protein